MTKKIKKNVLFTALIIMAACFSTTAAADAGSVYADEPPETVEFKVLATGDIHGQVTSYNYETEMLFPNFGLTKVSTLITRINKSLPGDNSILVDAGDTLYDYSTNFFYDNYADTVQPIYQVMAAMNYDCITLGNHELDYPWNYITTQLKGAGLYDKTVVSNLTYTDSAKKVFSPSIVITKEAVTSKGNTAEIRIGVVGATRKGISTRRQYYGFLTSGDIYSAVIAEAKRLKEEEKVDLVIALIHGGIGLLSGSDTSTHPGARLAKSSYIDGVVTAHSHESFPLNNGTYSAASYINIVNEEMGLIYNTPVVGMGSQGSALGELSYKLIVNGDGTYSMESSFAQLHKISSDINESKLYNRIYDKFLTILLDFADKTEYPIAKGQVYTNIDCFIQDNDLYQLFNNAKIQYGYNYIRDNLPQYENLPVIACTANILDSTETEIFVTEAFTSNIISQIRAEQSVTRDSGYVHMFKITGLELREWLEYNSSIYATVGSYTFEETFPALFAKSPKVLPLLQSAYFDDHRSFYVFDGISYTVDISQKARYYANGKMIASANKRITSLTYNGVEIKDKQEFVIVTDAFDVRYSVMPKDSQSVYTKNPFVNSKDIVLDYIRQLGLTGPVQVKADNNWKIVAPSGYQFAVGMPNNISDYIQPREWFGSHVATNKADVYYPVYYKGTFKKTVKLKQSLNVILSISKTKKTASPVDVFVTTTIDSSALINQMVYLNGIYSNPKDKAWNNAVEIVDNKFTVSENGTYSVLVKDSLKNVSINVVTVNNIDASVLDAPVCNNLTNRTDVITGHSKSNAIVYARLPDSSIYIAIAGADGNFSITIPGQKAYDLVYVYAELNGIISDEVELIVRRTGPDMPDVISDTYSATSYFSGFVDPNCAVYLRYGNTVYVGYGMTDSYKKCDYYKATYTIVETDITVEILGDIAYFTAFLPRKIPYDKNVYVYATDKSNKSSKGRAIKIGEEVVVSPSLPDVDALRDALKTEDTVTNEDILMNEDVITNENVVPVE